jgi:hypothetical protein
MGGGSGQDKEARLIPPATRIPFPFVEKFLPQSTPSFATEFTEPNPVFTWRPLRLSFVRHALVVRHRPSPSIVTLLAPKT